MSATEHAVMVISKDGDPATLANVTDVFDCDVVVFEPLARAYSEIKRLSPKLVIACLELDDPDGCQVLSMLTFDRSTSRIPVVVYATQSGSRPA
jgi:CheY-like chemotaxis protein